MDSACQFFESGRWEERVESHVGRVVDIETALRTLTTVDTQCRIEELAAQTDTAPASLAVMSIGDALSMVGSELPELTLAAAAERWRDERDWLPAECPHEPVEGTTLCKFHLPPDRYESVGLTQHGVTSALKSAVCSATGQEKRFIGVHLSTLDLSGEHIPATDNRQLDFRLATVDDAVDCSDADFEPPVTMVGADLCGDAERTGESSATATNRYVSVAGTIDFSGAEFADSADFKHVEFRRSTTFNDADFDDVAMFNYATCHGQFEFWATVEKKADFSKATLRETAQLRGTYKTAGIFNYTTFESDLILWNSTFSGKADFLATEFGGTVDFAHTDFEGVVRFCEATFRDTVNLADTAFSGRVRFRDVQAPDSVIDLRRSHLSAGSFEFKRDEAYFDLRAATLGKVSLSVTGGPTRSTSPFESLRIERTEFSGFDFSRHASGLKPAWRLDTLAAGWPEHARVDDRSKRERFEALEDTYLRAKSGATAAGHNKAASEFFVHEMRYRRKQYPLLFQQRLSTVLRDDPATTGGYVAAPVLGLGRFLVDGTRAVLPGLTPAAREGNETPAWQSAYRWVSNSTLGLVAGYGERPQRPLTASLLTVGVFAVGYWLLDIPPTADARFGLGYLLLSFQSFVTFILGSTPVKTGFAGQFLSTVEGFVGAFLIAVFVFTLTRSIHR